MVNEGIGGDFRHSVFLQDYCTLAGPHTHLLHAGENLDLWHNKHQVHLSRVQV